MIHKSLVIAVFVAGCGVSFIAAWSLASTTAPADAKPPVNTTRVVSWADAAVNKGDWGEMRVFFRGQTGGTQDVLAATAVVEPGKAVHRAHRHAEEEYLLINEGVGIWSVDGKEFAAKKGDCLYVEPWVFHGLTNTGKTPLVFTVVRYNPKGVSVPPRPDAGKDEK